MNNYSQMASNLLSNFMTTPNNSKRLIVSVNGIQEARNFALDRGENIILRDSNEDVIYVKACDELGKYCLKVYECLDVTEKYVNGTSSDVISRSDFDKLSNELKELKAMIKGVADEHNVKQSEIRDINVKSNKTV